MSSGSSFAEAEWLSDGLHYLLNAPEYAVNHFKNFYNNVGYPISLARGAYWLGISFKELGDQEMANKYFLEGAKFPMTYYGQLFLTKSNLEKILNLTISQILTKNMKNLK